MRADPFHQAYLVRLWAIHHDGDWIWRATVENVHTRERHAFADLPTLCHFLVEAAQSVSVAADGRVEQEEKE